MNNMIKNRAIWLLAVMLLIVPSAVRAQAPPKLAPPPVAPPPPPPPPAGAGDVPNPVPIPVMPVLPPNQQPNLGPQPVPAVNPGGPMIPVSPGIKLRYHFIAGQTLQYQITVDADGSVQMGDNGTKMPMKEHIAMTLTQTVQSVDASGDATVSGSASALSITMNGQAVPLPTQSQQQMSKPMTMVLSPVGKVLSSSAMPSGAASTIPDMELSQLQQLQALPDDAVTTGSTWHSALVVKAIGLDLQVKYTLASISPGGNSAAITQKIYGQFQPMVPANSAATKLPFKGLNAMLTGTGSQQWDIAQGQIASQIENLHLTVKITPNAPAQPVNMDWELTVDMERQAAATPTLPGAQTEPPTNQLQ